VNFLDWTVTWYRRRCIKSIASILGLAILSASASTPFIQPGKAYAQGATLFSDFFTGSDGAGWGSAKWATTSNDSSKKVDIQSNQGRLYVNGASARATSLMTATADAEVAVTYRFNESASGSFLRIFARASGATGASQMPNAYRVEIGSDSTTIKLQKFVNSVVTQIGSFNYTSGTTAQRLRFRVQGSTIEAKVWAVGTSEPAAWSVIATDTAIAGAGVIQVAHSHTTGTHTVFIDDLAVSDPATDTTDPGFTTAGGSYDSSQLVRHIHTDYGAHWIDIDVFAYRQSPESDGLLWALATVHAGALDGGSCVEFFHNINLVEHRSPDLISNCEANTTRTYPSFWLYRQDGGLVRMSDVDYGQEGANYKGVNVCVTEQGQSRRILGQSCFPGSSTYSSVWGDGTAQWLHPEPWEYDQDNYDMMLNLTSDGCSGCKRLRWLAGDHWNHDLSSYDRVVDPGTMWSSYYGGPGGGRYLWIFQSDGNLVVYRVNVDGTRTATWASGTDGHWGAKLRIQADGNLVIWQQETNDCIWHSNTWGQGIVRWANGHNGGFYGYRSDGSSVPIVNQQYC
jgi:hypothetical protein